MIEIFVPCIPPKTTAQSSNRIFKTKEGRFFVGKTDKGVNTRNELIALFAPYAPEKPFDDAVCVEVEWIYPYLKSVRKKDIGKEIPCTTRPDADNILKFFFDVLTRLGYWVDDSQVCQLSFSKKYSEKCGIFLKIYKKTLDTTETI